MIISDLAIDRRVTVYVLLLLILVAGLFSYSVLPRESNPEVIVPLIVVSTAYEGVSPSDIESLVTVPIERKLTGISGVKKIRSSSSEGMSVIEIEFEADEDIDSAMQKVRDKVDQAQPDLPPDADDPTLSEINFSEMPIMFLSLTGDSGLPIMSRFAEDLEDAIEAIRGVLNVEVIGGVEREIQITVDPKRAGAYGVSMADLVTLARVENVNTPAGSLELDDAKFLVRVPGEFRSAEEIENLVVKVGPGGIVYLRDIGVVTDGFKEIATISRLDGEQSVTLTVAKRAGENVLDICAQVYRVVEDYKGRLLPGMDIKITLDQSHDIEMMVSELENNILSGLILVLVVVFAFMGLLNAFMVALAIPVSMLIAFTAMYVTGTTLNMVVLFSLILALGMLVDNGIVVVENIYRHVQEGLAPTQAAKQGASEVAWPIVGSSLTTIAAFSPMFFWPGIWGSFMYFLPFTVVTTLCGSLFVGLIVNPALAAVFMHFSAREAAKETKRRHLLIRAYLSVLRLALAWRAATVVLAFTLLFVIGYVFLSGATIEFTPETEPRRAMVDIDCPEGTRLEVTDGIVREVEGIVSEFREHLEFVIANVGSRGLSEVSIGGGGGTTSHIGRVTLDFPPLGETDVLPSAIVELVRGKLGGVTGAKVRVELEQQGPPAKPPVNVEISGDDFGTLAEVADRIAAAIEGVPNIVDIRDDYEKGKPEIRVHVDRQQALLMGLNTQFVGQVVQAAIDGRKAGEYREGDEEYDVIVRFPKEFREDIGNLEAMTIVNLEGTPIPFSAVASIEYGAGFGEIKRINRKRTVTVMADADGRPGPEVLRDVREVLAPFPLPAGYTLAYTGENEENEEAQAFLSQAFVVALFLIALVLIAQFNSVLQPFIIMTSVILSLAGVFLGLYLHNMPFGVIMTGIGCISLAGVVVNNAIVLIDFINQRRAAGAAAYDAILEAAVTRFRPVLLTAVTTVLGLVPMALGVSFDFRKLEWVIGGESSQWWGAMAIAIIYGLSFATLLTLIVVPTLYSLFDSIAARFTREPAT